MTNDFGWQRNPETLAIVALMDTYRKQQGINIGEAHVGGDGLGEYEELAEQLARARPFDYPWPELANARIRQKVFDCVGAWVSHRIEQDLRARA